MKIYIAGFFLILTILYGCSPTAFDKKQDSNLNKGEESSREVDKRKAMDAFINGTNAESRGDYASAILEYSEALQFDPQPGIYYSLAKNYYFLNKLSLALQNINKAVELDEKNIDYLELQQDILITAKQYDNAIQTLNKIISFDSTRVFAYYQLARLYENNKPLKAIEVYNRILKEIGSEWNVLIRIAELYERLGMLDKAALSIEEMLKIDPSNSSLQKFLIEFYIRNKEYDKALSNVNELLQFYPDDLEAREKKATILAEMGLWEKASNEYQYLLKQQNISLDFKIKIGASYFLMALKDSTLLPIAKNIFTTLDKDTVDWQIKIYLGAIAIKEKKDSTAIEIFNKVIELAPWNSEAWTRLGGLLFDNRKYSEVIKILSKAIDNFPDDFVMNLILGLAYSQTDNDVKAKIFLSKAVELNPLDITALSALGYTLSQLKESDEAIIYLKKALQIDPENVDLMGTLGLIYDGKESWKECDSIYSLALSIDSTNALINNNFAYSLSKRGEQLELALKMVTFALEKDPYNSSYLDTKGWVYFKLGEYDKAKEFIQKSIDVGGEKAIILDHLGDVLFMMGKKDEAIKTWKKAFELDQTNVTIKNKIEKGEL